MIKKLHVNKYRKLNDIEFSFAPDINLISGTNGTCKTSILHLVSNSFQSITKKDDRVVNAKSIDIIKSINACTNPKLETLTKGDKAYNNPAPGCKGSLYEVTYLSDKKLEFRRHNSKTLAGNRYAVKPKYNSGSGDTLPLCPIIYLSLMRLVPFGEYQNESAIVSVAKKLPEEYQQRIANYYKSFTGLDITYGSAQKVGDIKTRADFDTSTQGIDSNTISAGEDNLFIILTALVSLQFYYESINSINGIESIMLVDELDATLHPAYQIKLMNLFKECADEYKIQFIFTSHSMTLIENALDSKYNVIYLHDEIDSVSLMEDVDIYKIKMSLNQVLKRDMYFQKQIPVFTEDEEARSFLSCLFECWNDLNPADGFEKVRNLFYLADIKISCEALRNIFSDSQILRATMRSICILDGDQASNIAHHIITLPGGTNPEEIAFSIAESLYTNRVMEFWNHPDIKEFGYEMTYYRDQIMPAIENVYQTLEEMKAKKESTHGVKRVMIKKVYNDYKEFFECVYKYWIRQPSNYAEVSKFFGQLKTMFKKVAGYNDINPREWN